MVGTKILSKRPTGARPEGGYTSHEVTAARAGRPAGRPNQYPYFLSLCPKSNPNFGADFVPLTFTGISAPAPFFLKKGSTGFNKIDFHRVATICDTFASVRIFPENSN
jgi:hypothetical protein